MSLNNVLSNDQIVTDGVPQGSILGPLLFLLFINDLPLYTNNTETDLYADDTTLYHINNTLSSIENNLQTALRSLSDWCKSNGMLINTSKTKVMLITTHQKRASLNITEINLHLNGENLSMISKDKVLGIVIDNNLTWKNHIEHICRKISSNIWLLSRIKQYLSLEHRIQFYKAYIQPHIDYCNVIWGGTCQSNLNRLFRLQKRTVKIILDYNVDNSFESMQDLKIFTIFDRIYLRKAKFMYKISKSKTPSYINEMFNLRQVNENTTITRSCSTNSFLIPKPNKEIFKQSLTYSGPIIWNNLPINIKEKSSTMAFQCNLIKLMKNV